MSRKGSPTSPRQIQALLLILFYLLPIQAQQESMRRVLVTGRILDQETKKPVPSVSVIVTRMKGGTTSDSLGRFRLVLPLGEKRVVVFSHIAYKTVTRPLSLEQPKEVEFLIHLVPQPIRQQDVVVTARKPFVLTRAQEQRASWRVDGAEIKQLGETEMEKAMVYLFPDQVKPLESRMMSEAQDFTLYVDGEWKESIFLNDIDPLEVRQVLVYTTKPVDWIPVGLSLRRGNCVIYIQTR